MALLDRPNGYELVNIARGGSSIRFPDCPRCTTGLYWKTRLAALKSTVEPDAYVVDFGINDTGGPGLPTSYGYADYGQKIDWLMPLFDGKPVLWTNLPCPIEPASRQHGCNIVNEALRDARSRWPNLTILGWNLIASSHPGFLGPPLGVHLTDPGARYWSAMVAGALDSRFPA